MSNKKKNARLKRQREEAEKKEAALLAANQERKHGTPFLNTSTGIIFLLTGIACAVCLVVVSIYMDQSSGKVTNILILAIMAVYFFWKAPSYFRRRKR